MSYLAHKANPLPNPPGAATFRAEHGRLHAHIGHVTHHYALVFVLRMPIVMAMVAVALGREENTQRRHRGALDIAPRDSGIMVASVS